MTADSSYSLEALERRWQLDKTPQVGLRLAEEYRRQGKLDRSIEALAAGLEVYPNHTSSRVALSRYLVDGGRFSEAVIHLEQIVSLDPAHLVANKLLVGAYAGVGRIDEARDKLAIYEMMGEGDADIERLQDLLEAAEGKTADGAEPAAEGRESAGEPEAQEVQEVQKGLEAPEDLEAPEGLEDQIDDPFQLPTPAPSVAPEASSEEAEEPFGAIARAFSAPSYWQGVADEGIFVLETEQVASPASSESTPAPEEPDEAPEGLEAGLPETGPVTGSTVTLGKLYRDQGLRGEAAEVFEEVLARDPGNDAARRELESIAGAEPETPVAQSDAANRREPDPAPSLADRRRVALTSYRARLRKAIEAGI